MRRKGSRNVYYKRRIPKDVQRKAAGLTLHLPVGDAEVPYTISEAAREVVVSLRTAIPAEVKERNAAIDAYLERIWNALRAEGPVSLTHRQVTAIAGGFYRAWTSDVRSRTTAVEQDPETGRMKVMVRPDITPDELEAVRDQWTTLITDDDPRTLEKHLGPVADRLLLEAGIARVDADTRAMLLVECARAMRDALDTSRRNREGDYSPDTTAARFPEWTPPQGSAGAASKRPAKSLAALIAGWKAEAEKVGQSRSTTEGYAQIATAFKTFLGHDDAQRLTRDDVIRYKDERLKTVKAKTVKDGDLAALNAVFNWAVGNGKLADNPAKGVTLKVPKSRRLRPKGFRDDEAVAILRAARGVTDNGKAPQRVAANRWVPWLCAYTGARVGEMVQLRKADVRSAGGYWTLHITPEAGTVKTAVAREVIVHPHLIDMGFIDFVKRQPDGYLFMVQKDGAEWRAPWRTAKNRVTEFVRTVVTDPHVQPNHAWRHRFKTVGRELGISTETLNAIQGHATESVSEDYGEVTLKTQAEAIAKFPRYKVA
jgi:integrase